MHLRSRKSRRQLEIEDVLIQIDEAKKSIDGGYLETAHAELNGARMLLEGMLRREEKVLS